MAGDPVGDNQRETWRAAAALGAIGMIMALSVFVGFGLGYAVDKWLGTLPWFSLGGTILGVVAGFREAFRIIRRFTRNF